SNSGFQQRDPNRSWFNQNKFLSDFLSLHPEAPFFSSSCYPSYVPFTSLISNHFIFTFTIRVGYETRGRERNPGHFFITY
ncbi:MAG: hypothetical protein ACAH17_00565, partial [Candidatus Paceibacterota bacterium]